MEIKTLEDAHHYDFAAGGDMQVLRPRAVTLNIPVTAHPFGTVVIPIDEAEQRCEIARGQAVQLLSLIHI